MGGRGSSSMSVGKTGQVIDVGAGKGGGEIDLKDFEPEHRADVLNMYGATGFQGMYGTNDMYTAVIGAYGIQLNNLERRYGAVGGSEKPDVRMVDNADFIAAVSYNPSNPSQQTLIFNHSDMGKIKTAVKQQRKAERSGWSMPTDKSVKNMARYTVTHEYGHMLHNSLYTKAVASGYTGTRNQWLGNAVRSIKRNAQTKYKATNKSMSTYGKSSSAEFFAEAFANANLGKPNAVGKAMNDWLKKQGF